MFKNKKIVLFLLVLPLVAVLVAPKVALADDDSDWVKNIPIIGGVVDFASDPGGWITDRFAEGAEFFFNDGLQNIKTTSTKSILGKSFNNLLGKKTGTFYSTVSFVNKSVVMPTAASILKEDGQMQIETPQAVAIYCRLSKEDLDENKIDNLSRSIQNQKSMLTDFAEINGWQIFDIYCDDNLSGVARDRPEFNRLIRDASLRKFNIILCKNQSRFTRDMQLVEKYIHGLFPIWGIRFVGMVDGADTSVKGNKKARQINGLVNQWYLENLSDNIKATLKLKRIRGKYTGSVLPYGYRPDPDDINCFIIDPVAASVVRRIWEMHAGGIGAPTIARTLNEEGIPNPTSYAKLTGYSWHNRPSSSLWSAGCIYSILHNETYLGTLCQGRQLTPEGQFHSKKNIPKDQWVRTVGHHPAIIDDELLRRELKARKEAGAHNLHEQKKNFPPGIFGKEVRCASCGKILTKGKTLRKTGYERTLFCPTRKKSPSHCKGAFISEKHLESAILHELKNLADRYSDDRVQIGICQDAQSADLIQERNRLKTAVELIEKEITAYEQRSRDLYLKRATDGMSIDDFNSALSRIRNDVDKLRLKSKRASSELLHLNESIAAESIRMETVLKAADFNHLDKTKVSMLIESVYVHKRDPKSGTQAIDITWKF